MSSSPCLPHLLRASTERFPDRAALLRQQDRTTYAALDQAADRLAAGLRELGLRPGERVALVLENVPEYVYAYYGILRAGGVVVPLCPDTRAGTLAFALSHCSASAVILGSKNSKLLAGQSADLPALRLVICHGPPQLDDQERFQVLELQRLLEADVGARPPELSPDDLASIIFTSGTTARPKGVMLSHRNLVANTRSIVQYLELTAEEMVALVLPFFYSYGNSVLHTHLCAGGSIAILGTMIFPAAVLGGIQKLGCTGFSGVPSTFARLLQSSLLDKFDLSSLRTLTQAGGPMTPALTEKLRQHLPRARLFVMYGQTEAAARLSYLPPEQLQRKLGSVGIGIPGVTLRVLDQQGTEVPRGTVGEIVAEGENVMMGYWNNPEETARVKTPRGLRTGDLGQMDEDGYLFIVGRETDMIKSGAHRIGPKEIEDIIEKLPEVSQCAVVGVPDELLGEAIVAFVVPVADATVTAAQVLHLCHEHLPRFKLPGYVRVVDSLPRTDTGKLRRHELREWFARGDGDGS